MSQSVLSTICLTGVVLFVPADIPVTSRCSVKAASNVWCWLYMRTKLFSPSLCFLSEQLSLATCKQRADHFTPMLWFDFNKWRFHFIRGRFHYSDYIKYCQNTIQNRFSSETHNWDMYATWEIEPKNLGFTQMTSQGGVKGQTILLILALMCFFCGTTCGQFGVI